MEKGLEWKKIRVGDLFEIQNTSSFNREKLTIGNEYAYVTRTSLNNGILTYTGFVNKENLNSANIYSLGLLQMDFFYQKKKWYAGQFVRKVIPNFKINDSIAVYFKVLLNKLKPVLLKGLVRDVDESFKNAELLVPIKNKKIAFSYMEKYVEQLAAERTEQLAAYLSATGLDDYELTDEDEKFMNETKNVKWKEYRLDTLFNIYPSKSYSGLKDADILSVKGTIPYISNQSQDNGSIGFSELKPLNKKNVITLSDTWQSERTIFYQGQEFIGKSHLQVLEPFSSSFNKLSAFYIISSFRKAITKLNYDYGTKFNRQKIKSTVIQLPTKDNKPDYDFMTRYITIVQKQVIKKLAEWTQKEVEATKEILDKDVSSLTSN